MLELRLGRRELHRELAEDLSVGMERVARRAPRAVLSAGQLLDMLKRYSPYSFARGITPRPGPPFAERSECRAPGDDLVQQRAQCVDVVVARA